MIRRPPRSTLFPLHDALPIYPSPARDDRRARPGAVSGFFASGLVVDLVLALVAVEAGLLAWHRRRTGRGVPVGEMLAFLAAGACLLLALDRKERRVGKECRSRGSPYHLK